MLLALRLEPPVLSPRVARFAWAAWHDAWRIELFVLHNNEELPLLDTTLSWVLSEAWLVWLLVWPSGTCTRGQRVEAGGGEFQETFGWRHRAWQLGTGGAFRRVSSQQNLPAPFLRG